MGSSDFLKNSMKAAYALSRSLRTALAQKRSRSTYGSGEEAAGAAVSEA